MDNRDRLLEIEYLSKEIFFKKLANFEYYFGIIESFVRETIEKLTFAMTIPKLLDNDYELIKNHLKKSELEILRKVFQRYLPQEKSWLSKKTTHQLALTSSLLSVKNIERYFNTYSSRTEDIPQRDEYEISNALNLLYRNEEIRKISETHKKLISEAAFNFLQDMKFFLYSLLEKMKLSPQEAEAREAYLRKLCNLYEEKTNEALILEEKTIEQVKNAKNLLRSKLNEVTQVKENIETLMKDFKEFIKKSSRDARNQMTLNWEESECKREILTEKIKMKTIDLEYLRKNFVEDEKYSRTIKSKTEQHLKRLLSQYDRDMQTRQNELDDCNDKVLKNRRLHQQLLNYVNDQERDYQLLMEEKERDETELREAFLSDFRQQIAARKVQRYYRNFRKLLRIVGRRFLVKIKKKRKKHSAFRAVKRNTDMMQRNLGQY